MAHATLHRLLGHLRKVAASSPAELTDRQLLERFAQRGDQAAFAALVERHGALVYGACRRLLGARPDADDVFQATFIVLARKAGALRWQESIGPWLHAVAVRLARKVVADAARRNRVEQRVQLRPAADPLEDVLRQELHNVLDAELHQLSQRHRAPLILCYLEGQTLGGAAQQLGWSLGTLKRRLERGRRLLRQRLVRRGLAPSAVTLTAVLTEANARAAVPAALIAGTIRLALLLQASETVVGSTALALADAMMKSFLMTKVKLAGAGLVIAALLAMGAGVLARPGAEPRSVTQASSPPANGPGDVQPAGRRAESLQAAIAARLASGSFLERRPIDPPTCQHRAFEQWPSRSQTAASRSPTSASQGRVAASCVKC